jgi:hypothetical protein
MSKTTARKKLLARGGAREPEFTDEDVYEIRRLAAKGISTAELAQTFKARYDTTARVVKGLSYKKLLAPPPPVVSTPLTVPSRGFDVGTRVADCDPRRQRTGTIRAIAGGTAEVSWTTGKRTTVNISKIHDRRGSKKGFLVIPPLVGDGTTRTFQVPEQAAA